MTIAADLALAVGRGGVREMSVEDSSWAQISGTPISAKD